MEAIFYVVIAILAGLIIGWFAAYKRNISQQSEKDAAQKKYADLEKEYFAFKATTDVEFKTAKDLLISKDVEIKLLNDKIVSITNSRDSIRNELATETANLQSCQQTIKEKANEINDLREELKGVKQTLDSNTQKLATANADNETYKERMKELENLKNELKQSTTDHTETKELLATANATNNAYADKLKDYETLKDELKQLKAEYDTINKQLATANANNTALEDKINTQKIEMEELGKKFNTEFENIANKILDTKTEKFTKLNSENLKTILDPLGKNIDEFKKQVDEVYNSESKERFSLGEKVKELAQLNQVISEEARNLTKALKGEAKTQGRWGEMILENILEKSLLVKDREYFIEHELLDDQGNPLKSDAEGKKMRPDAVIKYPDNRSVIIDSKVSLNAFTRLLAANDIEEQKTELAAHVAAIKNHIVALSTKGYDDYDKSLDFVMMFVPSEPAYIAAMQGDPDLWNFAYDKRILLLSPTNLITSLKLILDLWKREYQNRNAQEIAERGAKLYDKFVGFIENLNDVGDYLNKAHGRYNEAYKQLSTGNDNLVAQAVKLKNLGLKTKKELSSDIVNAAFDNDSIGQNAEQ